MTQLLQQIARKDTGISYGVRFAIKQDQEYEALKMLKSMTRDNENLMVKNFGQELVNQIKNEPYPLAN